MAVSSMSFACCETPRRELAMFEELLRKCAGLAQIIVDSARAGELGTC